MLKTIQLIYKSGQLLRFKFFYLQMVLIVTFVDWEMNINGGAPLQGSKNGTQIA